MELQFLPDDAEHARDAHHRERSGQDHASGDASIRAGNDINLTAARTSYGEWFNFGKKNRSEMRTTEDIGTQIAAGGSLTLMAVRDVNAIAAQVASDKLAAA